MLNTRIKPLESLHNSRKKTIVGAGRAGQAARWLRKRAKAIAEAKENENDVKIKPELLRQRK